MAQPERDLGEGGLVFDEIEGCGVDVQRIGPRFPASGAGVGLEERCPDQAAGIGPCAIAAESTSKPQGNLGLTVGDHTVQEHTSAEYQWRRKDKRQHFAGFVPSEFVLVRVRVPPPCSGRGFLGVPR